MSDESYDIFDDMIDEVSSAKLSKRVSHRKDDIDESRELVQNDCQHSDIYDDGTKVVCVECGQEISCDTISYDKEWKTNISDTRKSQRCTQRKQECKDIMKDLDSLDIPRDVKIKANHIFTIISEDGVIFRGPRRKGIIYGCVLKAYDYFDEYIHTKDVMYLQSQFKLDRCVLSKAINQFSLLYNDAMKKHSIPKIVKKYVSPENYIQSLVMNIGGDDRDIQEVMQLYRIIEANKSRILDVSRPQSFAAGLVFYYYIQKKRDTDVNKFVKDSNSGLSPLTVKKNMDEIDRILAKLLDK